MNAGGFINFFASVCALARARVCVCVGGGGVGRVGGVGGGGGTDHMNCNGRVETGTGRHLLTGIGRHYTSSRYKVARGIANISLVPRPSEEEKRPRKSCIMRRK